MQSFSVARNGPYLEINSLSCYSCSVPPNECIKANAPEFRSLSVHILQFLQRYFHSYGLLRSIGSPLNHHGSICSEVPIEKHLKIQRGKRNPTIFPQNDQAYPCSRSHPRHCLPLLARLSSLAYPAFCWVGDRSSRYNNFRRVPDRLWRRELSPK